MLKDANISNVIKDSPTTRAQVNGSEIREIAQEDRFEAMLNDECQRVQVAETTVTETNLKLKLMQLANAKMRLPANTNILEHWDTKKFEAEELYSLAMIALAVPATQVTVERCFSAIKLLLQHHRLRMSSERLDDIMTIRYNKDLLQSAIAKIQPIN